MRSERQGMARAALLAAAAMTASACGVFERRGEGALPDPDVVARDLVYTLAQVPELHPLKSTLQVGEPLTPFGEEVLARLDEAGYGLQRVAADHGPNYVRYRSEHIESETGERTRYVVSVGAVSVERDYALDAEGTRPRSRLLVSGVPEQTLSTDPALFDGIEGGLSTVAFDSDLEPEIRDVALGAASPSVSAAPRAQSAFGTAIKRNMYETLVSNYADVFTDFEDIEQSVLVFPNDSLRLGESNKETIARYVSELDPATDVLSVIGCSHGTTAIDNGNELLAIGRANRVKEAFLFAGIDHDQVLEESCWAGEHFEMMPRRGVVLTLKRRRDLG